MDGWVSGWWWVGWWLLVGGCWSWRRHIERDSVGVMSEGFSSIDTIHNHCLMGWDSSVSSAALRRRELSQVSRWDVGGESQVHEESRHT